MILDERNEFADAVALNTGAAGSYLIGDQIDLGVARDIGNGEPLHLVISVDTKIDAGASGTVQLLCERSSVVAMAYSFQVATKSRMNSAASAGLANGRMTCQKIRNVVAPSILADSSSSSGIARKNP